MDRDIYIYSTKKRNKILVFFGDFFINLILTIILLNGVLLPLIKIPTNFDNYKQEITNYKENELDLFYDNNLLRYEEDKKYDFNNSLQFSADKYLESFVMSNKNSSIDFFKTYFINIKKDESTFFKLLNQFNKNNYFVINGKNYKLNNSFINLFEPKYNKDLGDELSKAGEKEYRKFINSFFLPFYSKIILDIKINDLSSKNSNETYLSLEEKISLIDKKTDLIITFSAFVSFIISSFFVYFFIPVLDKRSRTVTEIILKKEKVQLKRLNSLNRKEIILSTFISIISNLAFMIFVPLLNINFNALFTIIPLLFFALIGVIFIIINLCFICLTKLNQSVKEILFNYILLDSEVINKYYEAIYESK